MILVKYNKVTKDIKCKCGGDVWVGGTATYRLPLGFGFHPGSNKFAIDSVQFKGWHGECEKCKKEVLAYTSRRVVTRTPRKLNRKIAAA